MCIRDSCVHFTKLAENPLIGQCPLDPLSLHFRDPKVFQWEDGTYRMVCGGSDHEMTTSAVMLYKSEDLLHWEYVGPIFQTSEMGPVMECPDLFPLGDKWVLDFSRMDKPQCVQFVVGDFDGEHFTPESFQRPVIGPQFYAPQTFLDPQGRRILIGWMTPWGQPEDPDACLLYTSLPQNAPKGKGIRQNSTLPLSERNCPWKIFQKSRKRSWFFQ